MELRPLKILVFPDPGGRWTARGLEHDIAAEGRSIEAALATLLSVTRAHIAFDQRHNREPLSAFSAAPRVYWTAFARASQLPPPAELESARGTSMPRILAAVASHHPAVFVPVPLDRTA